MRIVIIFSLIFTLGCTETKPSMVGNFVGDKAILDEEIIAGDTIKQMVELFPPAKTHLSLRQVSPVVTDRFGSALIEQLRYEGYAVEEPYATPEDVGILIESDGIPFRYIFDQDNEFYRVTIVLGDQTLTRPYVVTDGVTVPIGYWVYREY